tara:strand:- start:134 stop:415 length:282 start_codon:yes stop_codon:yes gene_type:complete
MTLISWSVLTAKYSNAKVSIKTVMIAPSKTPNVSRVMEEQKSKNTEYEKNNAGELHTHQQQRDSQMGDQPNSQTTQIIRKNVTKRFQKICSVQ